MPCRDQSYYDELDERQTRLNERDAMLCSVLSVLQKTGELKSVLDQIDEEEAGVTRKSIRRWFKDHQVVDAKRREREKRAAQEDEDAKKALAKLSPRERSLLGLDEDKGKRRKVSR